MHVAMCLNKALNAKSFSNNFSFMACRLKHFKVEVKLSDYDVYTDQVYLDLIDKGIINW